MRLIAALVTLVALAAAAYAGQALWQEINSPPDLPERPHQAGTTQEATPPAPPRSSRRWPALFGERQPPKPPAPPTTPKEEPQPPKPPKPPLTSLGYTLKGVVRTGATTWAMVGHPGGDRLLKVGDELEPDVRVARIDELGLWVSRDGDDPELMAFPE